MMDIDNHYDQFYPSHDEQDAPIDWDNDPNWRPEHEDNQWDRAYYASLDREAMDRAYKHDDDGELFATGHA